MNRRRFLIAAAAVVASPGARFDQGRILVDGREYALTDILAPTRRADGDDPGADFFAAAIQTIIREGAPIGAAPAEADRWGRLEGPVGWRTGAGRETTLQELLLSQGAARVFPLSADASFIERCYAAERAAREARLGNWRSGAWRIRDASRAEQSDGFQIYEGVIRAASERKSRVFFNFGGDFRSDFTASVARGVFRSWREKPDIAALAGRRAEVRGYVEYINGPSIELRHEMQLRVS